MNMSSPPPIPVQVKQRPWRPYLLALVGFLALVALACLGSFAASNAAQPGANGAEDTSAASAAAAGTPESAQWVKKKINFIYQGFTTHYSCDGLVGNVRHVLLELGARKSDLRIHESGCTRGFGQPEPFPGVVGTFSVLEPTASQAAGSGAAGAGSAGKLPVKAVWQTVHVRVGARGLDEAGQCELIDQVKTKILPLFAARDVKFQQNCFPHQLMIKGSTLSARVLKPVVPRKEVAQASP
ncbi:MAG: hypothetical protein ACREUG_00880 [Steroidobacteraceae bacterium]